MQFSTHTAVLVLAVEGFETRHLELVPFEGRDVTNEKVPALTTRHLKIEDFARLYVLSDHGPTAGGIVGDRPRVPVRGAV